jgi:hypothetical protein
VAWAHIYEEYAFDEVVLPLHGSICLSNTPRMYFRIQEAGVILI